MAMKKFLALVALTCISLSAQAFQTVELKEHPPLEPLHWCQNSDGKVESQRDKCSASATEVSSIVSINPDGTSTHKKLGATLEPSNDSGTANGTSTATDSAIPPASASVETTPAAKSGDTLAKDWRKSMLRMLFFAVVFGVVAKVIGRSFLLWFLVGAGVDFMLVVLKVFPH